MCTYTILVKSTCIKLLGKLFVQDNIVSGAIALNYNLKIPQTEFN